MELESKENIRRMAVITITRVVRMGIAMARRKAQANNTNKNNNKLNSRKATLKLQAMSAWRILR